jgi:hypothetical protein
MMQNRFLQEAVANVGDGAGDSAVMSVPVSTLTDTQEKILSLLPILPSLLSVFGSLTIVHMVLTSKRRSTPYKRLLLGMSVCDVVFSLSVPLWAFLLPNDTSHRVWAVGSDASCTVMGFFSQFSFSGILYNGMLSHYYLLTVRFAFRDVRIGRCAEPSMHILSIGFPAITAIIGAILGVYSDGEIGLQCWVDDYPRGCGVLEGESGVPCTSVLIAWIFGGWLMVFIILSMMINNVLIYRFVRQTIYRGRQRSSFVAGQGMDSQTRRVQAVATQGFLYVGSFVLTYTWQFILRIVEGSFGDASWESALFPIMVLNAIFMPSQGFFNLLIYVRPNYMRARKEFPEETKLWCFHRALHGNVIEPKNNSRMQISASQLSTSGGTGFFLSRRSSRGASADQNSDSFFVSRRGVFRQSFRREPRKQQQNQDQQEKVPEGEVVRRGDEIGCASDIEQAPYDYTYKIPSEWVEDSDDEDSIEGVEGALNSVDNGESMSSKTALKVSMDGSCQVLVTLETSTSRQPEKDEGDMAEESQDSGIGTTFALPLTD